MHAVVITGDKTDENKERDSAPEGADIRFADGLAAAGRRIETGGGSEQSFHASVGDVVASHVRAVRFVSKRIDKCFEFIRIYIIGDSAGEQDRANLIAIFFGNGLRIRKGRQEGQYTEGQQ